MVVVEKSCYCVEQEDKDFSPTFYKRRVHRVHGFLRYEITCNFIL